MAYLLDANVFINAKNLHYGFEFCPAYWEWIIREHRAGRVFSIDRVGDEIAAMDDELSEWSSQLDEGFFLTPGTSTMPALGTVAEWVNTHDRYTPDAKNVFLQIADYYLVAQALAEGHIVVTHEKPENSVHRVKIPNVCLALKIRYMNPFEMLRREKARFVLK